jgi:hypothetical protein
MIEVIVVLFSIITFLIIGYVFLGIYFGICNRKIYPSDNNITSINM